MHRLVACDCLAVAMIFSHALSTAAQDYADVDPRQLGVEPVPRRTDPKTGFVIGGKNRTAVLAKLGEIVGVNIADLEDSMRPGVLSTAGFLGKDEKLLDVLVADNRLVVDELGLTHQQLARPLRVLGAVARTEPGKSKVVTYGGRRFRIQATLYRASVRSPFEDGTGTNCVVTIHNLANDKKLTYSLLVPEMVERYGFYEGKGTRYRLEPRSIIEVCDFLKNKPLRRAGKQEKKKS